MLLSLTAVLALSGIALGLETTKTQLLCQTQMGSVSPYNIPTHTTTLTSYPPVLTVAFTTRPTTTLTNERPLTFNKTATSVETITTTVTGKLTGSTFTTTLTKSKFVVVWDKYTVTSEVRTTSYNTTTATLHISAPYDFVAINATVEPTAESMPTISRYSSGSDTGRPSATAEQVSNALATPDGKSKDKSEGTIVYVLKDGRLVPTPIAAIADMIFNVNSAESALEDAPDYTSVPGALPISNHDSVSSSTQKPAPAPASEHTTESTSDPTPEPTPEPTSDPAIADVLRVADAGYADVKGKREAVEMLEETTTTRSVPTKLRGLQGALYTAAAVSNVVYPTLVACTRLVIKEETVYRPTTLEASFVEATPVTNFFTTVSTVTVTATVPDRSPFRTASFVTTRTGTTTMMSVYTVYQTSMLNLSVTTTTQVHAACATDNFLGPILEDGYQIINVYNSGMEKYSSYTLGHSRNAEDCCIECHTAPEGRPCMGSVFTDGRCMLLADQSQQCIGQSSGAGIFVVKPKSELDKWAKKHSGRRLQEFVLSNGPCGYLYDGGVAW